MALPRLPASPAESRPRERLAQQGPEALSDAELLTLILGPGGGPGGAPAGAAALLRRFRTLHGLSRARFVELTRVPGLGAARAAAVQAALALGARAVSSTRERGGRVRGAADVHARLSPALRHHPREVFAVVLLDARHRILGEVRVAEGGLTACAIHPREVLEPAIREAAAAVVLVHNHPSGDPTPSPEDVALTRRLVAAGDALGIRVLDHVVIGDGRYASLADQGLILPAA